MSFIRAGEASHMTKYRPSIALCSAVRALSHSSSACNKCCGFNGIHRILSHPSQSSIFHLASFHPLTVRCGCKILSPPWQILSPVWQMTLVLAAEIDSTAVPFIGSPKMRTIERCMSVAEIVNGKEQGRTRVHLCRSSSIQHLRRIMHQLSSLATLQISHHPFCLFFY